MCSYSSSIFSNISEFLLVECNCISLGGGYSSNVGYRSVCVMGGGGESVGYPEEGFEVVVVEMGAISKGCELEH